LRLFTDVRAGEGKTAILLFVNVFLILTAYYFIKPLREGWIAVSDVAALSKMEVKAYSSFGQSVLLVWALSLYGRLADRHDRRKLISIATLFCISNLVAFWLLQPGFFVENLPGTGIAFYLWVGMFGVFIVAQFWAFAADVYDEERGNRLIPLIAIGATAGAASGAWITDKLVGSGVVSAQFLLLAAVVPLGLSLVLTNVVDARGPLGYGSTRPDSTKTLPTTPPRATAIRRGALDLVIRNRYLLSVAVITLLMNWVNTNGENLLFRVVQEALGKEAAQQGVTEQAQLLAFTRDGTTAFYGNFFFWVNVSALVLQAFVASRLLKYGGFATILLLLPCVALVSYTAMALFPLLAMVKTMKVAENATDYSINNTARHVLWLPVDAETKYKGKPAIDSLFARIGDGFAAATVLVGVHVLRLTTAQFFAFTVALVVLWIFGATLVVAGYRRLAGASAPRET